MNYQLALLNRRRTKQINVADVPDLMLIIAEFCEDDCLSSLSRVLIPSITNIDYQVFQKNYSN